MIADIEIEYKERKAKGEIGLVALANAIKEAKSKKNNLKEGKPAVLGA